MADKSYINIAPPFSLNTHLDEASPERAAGGFSILKNYIPDEEILVTREGITVFAHTPWTTTTPGPYDPSSDPDCICWIRFEESSVNTGTIINLTAVESIDDEIQGVGWWNVTANNSISPTLTCKEGTGAWYTDYYYPIPPGPGLWLGVFKEYCALETINFPGYTDGKHSFIMAMWLRMLYIDSANKTLYISRTQNTKPGGFIIGISSASGSNHFYATIADSVGITRTVCAETSIQIGTWYHVALWSSVNVGNSGLVVYDSVNDTETAATCSPALVHAGQYSSGTTNNQGIQIAPSFRAGRGQIDDFIVCVGDLITQNSFIDKIGEMRDSDRWSPANDFTSDSDVVALWKFDGNYVDSINAQNLSTPVAPSFNYIGAEGISCLEVCAASSQRAELADGSLLPSFPGQSTGSEKDFSVCCWARPKAIGASTQGIVTKWDSVAGGRAWAISMNSFGDARWQIGSVGDISYTVSSDASMVINNWYHIGCTYKASDNSMVMRVRHEDGTLLGGHNHTGTAPGNNTMSTHALQIGRINQTSPANNFTGNIDEVVVINRLLTDAEIDKIFNKTYS